MHFVVIEDGRIARAGTAAFKDLDEAAKVMGLPRAALVEALQPVNPERAWWDGKQVREAAERPSDAHALTVTGEWRLVPARAWAAVRHRRDTLLAATDWVTLRAGDQGEPVPEEWLTYRQALRDVTEQADPSAITWPAPPAG